MKRLLLISAMLLIGVTLDARNSGSPDSLMTAGPGSYQRLVPGDGPVRIPFTMHRGKPLIELQINGKKATLMIDNGILWDQVWLFGSALVGELDLKPVEESSIEGAGEGDPATSYFVVRYAQLHD